MKIVKSICKNCKHVEEYSKKELLLKNIFNVFLTFFVLIGILFTIYISIVGISNIKESVLNAGFDRVSSKYSEELRLIAINVTKPCDGDYSFCYAQKIFDYIGDIRYIPFNEYSNEFAYDPLYVLEHGGNCRDVSNLYVAMLKSIGIKSEVNCKLEEHHCIAVVPEYSYGEYKNRKLVVDLTIPYATILNDSEEVWSYLEWT